MQKKILGLTAVLAMMTLAACETVQGAGRDISTAGAVVQQESAELKPGCDPDRSARHDGPPQPAAGGLSHAHGTLDKEPDIDLVRLNVSLKETMRPSCGSS